MTETETIAYAEKLIGENLMFIHDKLDWQVRSGDPQTLKAVAAFDEAWRALAKALLKP